MQKIKPIDHGLPTAYLKALRREMAEKWMKEEPTFDEIGQMSDLHGAIAACEAVMLEIEAE